MAKLFTSKASVAEGALGCLFAFIFALVLVSFSFANDHKNDLIVFHIAVGKNIIHVY